MNRFEELSRPRSKPSVLADMMYFFHNRKKWWMAPIIGLLLLVGVMILLGGTAVAPFIYTLF
jgi:Family of unknown function (DUF5989)